MLTMTAPPPPSPGHSDARRPALTLDVEGTGPLVVLVHGVGLGPETFTALADELRADATVAIVHRPGYGTEVDAATVSLTDQVDGLAAQIASLDRGPAVVVGVRGGATRGRQVALARPDLLRAVVLHEPLVGPLAPALHDLVAIRAAELAADPDPEAPGRFVSGLVGATTWARLPSDWQAAVTRSGAVVRCEVPWFADVAPSLDELAALRSSDVEVRTTLGASSGSARRQAAGVLASAGGAHVHELCGVGHLAHVEAPAVLAGVVRAALADEATKHAARCAP